MKKSGKLYLIPTSLTKRPLKDELKQSDLKIVEGLKYLIVETPKVTRSYLKGLDLVIQDIDMRILDEHTNLKGLPFLLEPLIAGFDVGLMSDAGVPAVADPGSLVVRECHRLGITVVPMVGPSSILLSLMASGMNGQSFSFVGYLPRDPQKRKEKIKNLERESLRRNQTQIFIEAPYRNRSLFEDLLASCNQNTDLTLAVDITGTNESIKTMSIKDWRMKKDIRILDIPTIYLILARR